MRAYTLILTGLHLSKQLLGAALLLAEKIHRTAVPLLKGRLPEQRYCFSKLSEAGLLLKYYLKGQ
jgi:hypothetical protein